MRCDNPDCKTAPPPKADHRGGRGRPGLLRRPLVLTLGGGPAREASASAVPSPKGSRATRDRVAYLQSYGWEVSAEPLATEGAAHPQGDGCEL